MFKRLRWMGMGAVAGVGASAWAQRRVRQTMQQHPSIRTGADLASAARRVGREVGAAVAEGRRAMTGREAALRAELDARAPAAHRSAGGPGGARFGPTAGDPTGRRPAPGHPAAARPADGRPDLHVVDATSRAPRPRRLGT